MHYQRFFRRKNLHRQRLKRHREEELASLTMVSSNAPDLPLYTL